MNNHPLLRLALLILVLGIATSASADELDTLIYKQRGIVPLPEVATPAPLGTHRPAVMASAIPQAAPTLPADAPQAAPTLPEDAPQAAPTLPADEPQAAPSHPADEPQAAPMLLTGVPPVEQYLSRKEFRFPAGSQSSRAADTTLIISLQEGETHTFPVGSRAFRLPDGTLRVVVPETPATAAPDSSGAPQASQSVPVVTSSRPVPPIVLETTHGVIDNGNTFNQTDANMRRATDGTGFYLSVRGLGATLTARVDGDKVENNDLDSFVGGSIALGQRLSDTVRIEIEGGASAASKGEDDATIALGLVNLIYTLPLGQKTVLFLGAGAGVLYYKEKFQYTESYYYTDYSYSWYYGYRSYQRRYSYTAEGSGDATLFAVNALAGLSYNLGPSISLDLAFRYITTLEGTYTSDEVGDANLRLGLLGGYAGVSFLF